MSKRAAPESDEEYVPPGSESVEEHVCPGSDAVMPPPTSRARRSSPPLFSPHTMHYNPSQGAASYPAAAAAWADFTPEILGNMSTYLPVDNILDLLVCVGPLASSVIRRMYLTGNDNYLDHILPSFNHRRSEGRIYSSSKYEKKTCQIRAWMAYNEMAWKERCQGKRLKKNICSISVPKSVLRKLEFGVVIGSFTVDNPRLCDDSVGANPKWKAFSRGSNSPILVSIGKIKLRTPPKADEGDILDIIHNQIPKKYPGREKKVKLRFLRGVDTLFHHPVRVIEFGLTEVLRYQIETAGIVSPNARLFNHIGFNVIELTPPLPLLFYAALNTHDASCVRYLLSIDSLVDPFVSVDIEFNRTKCSFLHFILLYPTNIPTDLFKQIVNDPRFDVNRQTSGSYARNTPLAILCTKPDTILTKFIRYDETLLQRIRLLLMAGADPSVADGVGRDVIRRMSEYREDIIARGMEELWAKIMRLLRGFETAL